MYTTEDLISEMTRLSDEIDLLVADAGTFTYNTMLTCDGTFVNRDGVEKSPYEPFNTLHKLIKDIECKRIKLDELTTKARKYLIDTSLEKK